MNYIYHEIPENMCGSVLYPLNILKEKYPEIYNEHVKKYEGREELMNLIIPKLNCLWNDVIHLSAIHPQVIKDALREAGGRKNYTVRCYQIDPQLLDPEKTIVYLYSTPVVEIFDNQVMEFKPDEISKYSSVPPAAMQYYKETYATQKGPFPFHLTPHILYKGSIDTTDLPIIEV